MLEITITFDLNWKNHFQNDEMLKVSILPNPHFYHESTSFWSVSSLLNSFQVEISYTAHYCQLLAYGKSVSSQIYRKKQEIVIHKRIDSSHL